MPNIRILNWNIQQLSAAKLAIPGMATAIARTIVALNPDVAVILEVRHANAAASMQELAEELNAVAGGGTAYQTWQLSERTGLEHYAFFIRDTARVRPMQFAANPVAPAGAGFGTKANPVSNLEWVHWQTWPAGVGWGAAVPAGQAPSAPLVTRFSRTRLERAPKRRRASFSGRSLAEGGYGLGTGSRLPCLAVFQVHTAAGDYYFPVVTCHYAAVEDGRNHLGQGQIKQLPELHVAQLFAPVSGFLHINGGPIRVQELIFTGDFNVDFRQNLSPGGSHLQTTNRETIDALTPTQQMGGSAGPPAGPGAVGPVPPFGPPWSAEPEQGTVPNQELRAAVTWQKTIFQPCPPGPQPPPAPAPPPLVPPANRDAARTAAFDNFFYGGTRGSQVAPGVIPPGPPGPPPPPANPDSGRVDDLTLRIAPPPPAALAAGQVEVSGPAFKAGHAHGASWAPNLQVPGAALTVTDQWIGATLISDHVPVVLEIPCP